MTIVDNTFGRQWKLLKRSPFELKLLYILNFLNSYKYFSMALVLPLIATAEYGLSDTQAGGLYGTWGLLITVWGFIASAMVDKFGVRSTAIFSTVCSVLARFVFVFCRSQRSLYISVLVLSPMGDGTFDPCFNVGLKKCTTELTRPFAYACAYTVMNLGGAFSDNLTDFIRRMDFTVMGIEFSGLRSVLLSSLLMMIVASVLACTLRELTDQEAERTASALVMTPTLRTTPQLRKLLSSRGTVSPGSASALATSALARNNRGRQSKSTVSYSHRRVESPRWIAILGAEGKNEEEEESAPHTTVTTAPVSNMNDPNFWRVVVFMSAILFTSQQWRYIDLVMPKLCTRNFGDSSPFANIQSINPWGCVIFPPIISSLTSGMDDLLVMLPGIWLMAMSSLPLLFYDSIDAVALWIAILTIGEVIWSPRSSSYAASMAPVGREGMFLMLCSWPTYLTKYPAGIFSGWLLSQYSPDCNNCKNRLDQYCDASPRWLHKDDTAPTCLTKDNLSLKCPSSSLIYEDESFHCAQTCRECPGWDGDIQTLFMWVFFLAMISPVAITLLYPCLRRPDQNPLNTPPTGSIEYKQAATTDDELTSSIQLQPPSIYGSISSTPTLKRTLSGSDLEAQGHKAGRTQLL